MSDEMPEQEPAEAGAPEAEAPESAVDTPDAGAAVDAADADTDTDTDTDTTDGGEAAADDAADDTAAVSDRDAFSAGTDASTASASASGADPETDDGTASEDGPSGRPAMERAQLEAIVEALVFASPEPLTPKMLFKLLSDEPKEDVQAALETLTTKYESGGGLHLAQVAGGFQITTRPELHEWVRRLFHERSSQKLSVAALETLSVIAYRQPVTAAEVNEIRAVNASGVLSTLLERHLIKIVGRKNVVGRPFLYGTTKEFLLRFGLKDLTDLPKIEDMVAALGFEPPPMLLQKSPSDELLPLEGDDLSMPGASEE